MQFMYIIMIYVTVVLTISFVCFVSVSTEVFRTKTIQNDHNPVWHDEVHYVSLTVTKSGGLQHERGVLMLTCPCFLPQAR